MNDVIVRNTRAEDFDSIIAMTKLLYPNSAPWTKEQLGSHLQVFPEGQFVAVWTDDERIIGMAASLIVRWDDYEMGDNWRDFTDHGTFRNHDPERGRTLYGADVMVHPDVQGQKVGTKLYSARRELAYRMKLRRIRAGARLRHYHKYAAELDPFEYTLRVVRGEIYDPTLTFQLRRGFRVVAVVGSYIRNDSESMGYAAVIEWLNPKVAKPQDYAGRDPRFNV